MLFRGVFALFGVFLCFLVFVFVFRASFAIEQAGLAQPRRELCEVDAGHQAARRRAVVVVDVRVPVVVAMVAVVWCIRIGRLQPRGK